MDAKLYRFRIQRRIRITAHDRHDKKFLLGESWHTLAGFDYRDDASWLLRKARKDRPRSEFRMVEGPYDRVVRDWRSGRGKIKVEETCAMQLAVNTQRRGHR